MTRTDRSILILVAALSLVVAACAQVQEPEAAADEGLAKVEDIAGSDVKRVTLTDDAVERIKLSVLDSFGCCLFGASLPWTQKVAALAKSA